MSFHCDAEPLPGAHLMARDAARLRAQELDPARPATLQLYRWERPTLTVGHGQTPGRDFDLEALRRADVPWVRRPTGGRAILHHREWTYSVVGSLRDARFGDDRRATFGVVTEIVRQALTQFGVRLDEPAGNAVQAGDGRLRGACFASRWGFEISVAGRKLVGSAQRRGRRAFLQQGTLLVGSGHERIVEWLRVDPAQREELRSALVASTTTLSELLETPPDFARFAGYLQTAWAHRGMAAPTAVA